MLFVTFTNRNRKWKIDLYASKSTNKIVKTKVLTCKMQNVLTSNITQHQSYIICIIIFQYCQFCISSGLQHPCGFLFSLCVFPFTLSKFGNTAMTLGSALLTLTAGLQASLLLRLHPHFSTVPTSWVQTVVRLCSWYPHEIYSRYVSLRVSEIDSNIFICH